MALKYHNDFLIRLRKAKREAPPNEKPAIVKTHMRNMIVLPEMIGSVIGVHSGKTFNQVEVKVRFVYYRQFLEFIILARDGWALFGRICHHL